MPHKLLFRMKDYDFNVLEVYDHSTASIDGLYWEDVIVDTRYYNSKSIFRSENGTKGTRIYYINKRKNIVDEKNTFCPWYLEELKRRRNGDAVTDEMSSNKKNVSSDNNTPHESSSSNSSNDEEGYCKKLMLTVLPVLPIWWVIKLPFSIIAYPFRKLSSSSKDATLFPHYSLNKF